MAGRPRKKVEPSQAKEIARLWRLGRGARRIAKGLPGLSRAQVARELTRQGLRRGKPSDTPWSPKDRQHLQEHAGERDPKRLARVLKRTEGAVRGELSLLGLSLGELRSTLTVAQVCRLTGRTQATILGAIARKDLRAHRSDGAGPWRVWPADLRAWILERLSSAVDLDRLGDPEALDEVADRAAARLELLGLLAGLWGVTDETERRSARRKRARDRQDA